jgi:DNA-binding Lrp family transcriptional regulator
VSVKVSSWVWHEATWSDGTDISGNDLVFLLSLADVADDNGRCRFVDDEEGLTYPALQSKARISKSTVVRIVDRLREDGLIEHRAGVKGRPNEFRVLVPWAQISGANMTPNGDSGVQDSVSSGADSVSSEAVFGVNDDALSSLSRTNVSDVTTSATPLEEGTVGQRFAQPLCDVLSAQLIRLQVKHSVTKRWLDAARLLVDADGRDPHEAKALIEWALRDSFWMQNIHSMPKFRERYDQLRLRMGNSGKPSPTSRAQNVIEMGRRMEAGQGQQKAVAQ